MKSKFVEAAVLLSKWKHGFKRRSANKKWVKNRIRVTLHSSDSSLHLECHWHLHMHRKGSPTSPRRAWNLRSEWSCYQIVPPRHRQNGHGGHGVRCRCMEHFWGENHSYWRSQGPERWGNFQSGWDIWCRLSRYLGVRKKEKWKWFLNATQWESVNDFQNHNFREKQLTEHDSWQNGSTLHMMDVDVVVVVVDSEKTGAQTSDRLVEESQVLCPRPASCFLLPRTCIWEIWEPSTNSRR